MGDIRPPPQVLQPCGREVVIDHNGILVRCT
jgi:hypothetical protein